MKSLFYLIFTFVSFSALGQNLDSVFIARIFDSALLSGRSYPDLTYLCEEVGPRLSGSKGAEKALDYTENLMASYNYDRVFRQDVLVPHWERGEIEFLQSPDSADVYKVCALGGSVSGKGTAQLIEVFGLRELEELGAEAVKGKIVFFNRPMDPRLVYTFGAYGTCVDQRVYGAIYAARMGAVAVVVRSMNLRIDDFPHTGTLIYSDSVTKIPALAISTLGAENLSEKLKNNPKLQLSYATSGMILPDTKSHNVVGEIKGKKTSIIAIGGHIDSWDLGQGAHDDGAGCIQSIEALRILKILDYEPNNTLRSVMFMNEENGLKGALKYAELAKKKGEVHLAAIEADRGAFAPRGFFVETTPEKLEKMQAWLKLLEPYGIHVIKSGGAGADVGPLKKVDEQITLIGFVPDSQRYFDFHHSANDTIEGVNRRELELGSAALASLIYLIDKYGL